jgi:hypothetical protein
MGEGLMGIKLLLPPFGGIGEGLMGMALTKVPFG